MANELDTIRDNTLGTIFEPATLEVQRYDEMKDYVKSFADMYTNLVFTSADRKSAEEVRSTLLEIQGKFEKERKIIKAAYNEPLNEYEKKIKELNGLIDVPLNQIRQGLKEVDEKEREARTEALQEVLEEKEDELGVKVEIEKSWTNKGMWTSKFKPTAKLLKEIDMAFDSAIKEKKHREAEIKILNEFCNAKDIDSAGWVSQLDYKSATEIIDLINLDMKRRAEKEKERLENEARRAEEEAKKTAEYEEFKAKREAALAEINEFEEIEIPTIEQTDEVVVPSQIVNVIRVKGTQQQLNSLNEFLVDSGIEVSLVADETDYEPIITYAIDDLPF